MGTPVPPPRPLRVYDRRHLDTLPQLARLDPDVRLAMRAVACVLPFRVNDHVLEALIDWDRVPDDPIFQLTFPQPGMLDAESLLELMALLRRSAPEAELQAAARAIQRRLNPHPAGQRTLNTPRLGSLAARGMQHKYRETVLFFPAQGQTCHAYCTYCFRWPQFMGLDELKFAESDVGALLTYLRAHREVTDVLFTGGDPLVMRTTVLRRYLAPLLAPEFAHVASIRIGTKAATYWPYRFGTDRDADDLLRLFESVRAAGRHLALMAHVSHPRELAPEVTQQALRRLQSAGAVVRCQAPLVRHVNDDAATWAELWRREVALGAVPYYMFVERDTGPRGYFEVPLARAHRIYTDALRQVSGLARTVRGPSMSATPGKVVVDGVAHVAGQRVFALRFLQGRDPAWVGRPFFAEFDERAAWLDQLRPAFGQSEFFYEAQLRAMAGGRHGRARPDPAAWWRAGAKA